MQLDIEKITSEYEQTLVIPGKKPIPQFFLCPVGLVGAGKSTVMKPLCERLSVLRISNDEIREIIADHEYFDKYPLEVSAKLGEKYARQGYSIGLDANASTAWNSESFNQLLKELGAKAIWIYINPPEDYILDKLSHYPHGTIFRNKEEAISSYTKSKETVKADGIPFVYEFDPSRSDLDKQLDEAVQKIQQHLLSA